MIDSTFTPHFDENALRILTARYFARLANGELENPTQFVSRVATAIARPERLYAERNGHDLAAAEASVAQRFYDMLARRDFEPNTPCLVNAGRPLSMLSACFVLPVPDTMDGIFESVKSMAMIQKAGGGTGFAFSALRQQGALVASTGKDSSGPLSFMKVFNSASDSIKQGGQRRGANMAVLRVDHPDILEFVRSKNNLDVENTALFNRLIDSGRYDETQLGLIKQELLQTQLNNFNISVGVTNAFMTAVETEADFALRDPRDGNVVKTVPATEIWEAIVEGAWQNGEPGVLFIEHPRWNALPGLGPITATNPCVTGDTIVATTNGPRLVEDLVGIQFEALVDGEPYASSSQGFWSTGLKPTIKLFWNNALVLTCTSDHPVYVVQDDGTLFRRRASELGAGDRLAVHRHILADLMLDEEEAPLSLAAASGGTLTRVRNGNDVEKMHIDDLDVIMPALEGFGIIDGADGSRPYVTLSRVEGGEIEEVYDCNIPGPHAFDANGLYVGNCGEQALHAMDACNLGSINLGNFFDTATQNVDWPRLATTVHDAIRFMDNVIDENVYPLEEIAAMVRANRRVGLGIMGFADLLIDLRLRYGSSAAIAFVDKLWSFCLTEAEVASEQLAIERGDFPNKHLSIYANDPRPRRNAALLCVAPTGTIATIAGTSAFGCEPYFGIAFTKHIMKGKDGLAQDLYMVVPRFEEIARREGFFTDDVLAAIAQNNGSLRGIDAIPADWQELFVVSADVTVDEHIDMLAAFQRWTCNAVSKTINAPNSDTRENVARAIVRAYTAGCKGFTYYRDGSRTEQVVTFAAPAKDPIAAASAIVADAAVNDSSLEELLAQAKELLP